MSGQGTSKYPRQDSNLRTRLRRPVLYPLSYGGAPNRASGSYPQFCRVRHLSREREAHLPAATGLAGVTRPHRLRCDGTEHATRDPASDHGGPGPPALLPWPPRLRAAVTGAHPRLPGELSPWPPGRAARSDRSSLCCGCRHAPSRATRPHLRFREVHMSVAVGKFLWPKPAADSLMPCQGAVRKGRFELPPSKARTRPST